jgi:hypothetical protein
LLPPSAVRELTTLPCRGPRLASQESVPLHGVQGSSAHGLQPAQGLAHGGSHHSPLRVGSSQGGLQKPSTSHRWQVQLPDINNGLRETTYTKRGKTRHSNPSLLQAAAEPEVLTESGASCGLCTIKGLKPGNPNWQNQDSYVMSVGLGPGKDVALYSVLDGHGEVGHLVSQRCRDQIPAFMAQVDFDPVRASRIVQQDLLACATIDVQCSGATCVMATIRDRKLKVTHARTHAGPGRIDRPTC